MLEFKIIAPLLKLAVVLAIGGGLVKASHFMMLQAFEAQKTGFVSYRAINHALIGTPRKR